MCYEDFRTNYKKFKHLPIFTWILQTVNGIRPENMNLEPENEVKGYERRLSIQQ